MTTAARSIEKHLQRHGTTLGVYEKGRTFDEGDWDEGFVHKEDFQGRLDVWPSEREQNLGDKDSAILEYKLMCPLDTDIKKGNKVIKDNREFRVHVVGKAEPNQSHLEVGLEEVTHG